MKIIVHAAPYMAGRAADLAARQMMPGAPSQGDLIGIADGEHYFSICRNKSSITVWHTHKRGDAADPDAF